MFSINLLSKILEETKFETLTVNAEFLVFFSIF